ncbi:MAG: ribosome-inactivating family protein [Alphaproteobacteria bacterium]|jgi:hypothetical protein|nr:ribosome-inactivating family protein [Alphaproteobacteria bacterium]
MYYLLDKSKSFILAVIVFLGTMISYGYAWDCPVVPTNMSLDRNYVRGLENLGNMVSERVRNRQDLRQTLPQTIRTTATRCVQVNMVNNNGTTLGLIFSTSDLYLQGFITTNNMYFIFPESDIRVIPGTNTRILEFGRNYRRDLKASGMPISYENINNAVNILANFEGRTSMEARQSLARVMFVTSEALRFRSVSDVSVRILANEAESIRWNDFSKSVNNWIKLSNRSLRHGVEVSTNLQDKIGTINDVQIARRKQ